MSLSIKLRAVLKGDDMIVAVSGGFISREVPEDGVVVATELEELFLPESKVRQALQALQTVRAEAEQTPAQPPEDPAGT